jgi:predicted  nucleic acid-binding Zn-ribbon protein
MTQTQGGIRDIAARLKTLTDKLKRTTDQDDRRALLKQFRALLEEADKIVGGDETLTP